MTTVLQNLKESASNYLFIVISPIPRVNAVYLNQVIIVFTIDLVFHRLSLFLPITASTIIYKFMLQEVDTMFSIVNQPNSLVYF